MGLSRPFATPADTTFGKAALVCSVPNAAQNRRPIPVSGSWNTRTASW